MPLGQQWNDQSLGHTTQADHSKCRLDVVRRHRKIQRAAAPQAGDGAEADSDGSATSISRLTTVGEDVSSWLALVTVTQLGANRKMLSPTRS